MYYIISIITSIINILPLVIVIIITFTITTTATTTRIATATIIAAATKYTDDSKPLLTIIDLRLKLLNYTVCHQCIGSWKHYNNLLIITTTAIWKRNCTVLGSFE